MKVGDTMSEVPRDYAYQVHLKKSAQKPEPTISLDALKQYQDDIEKYIKKNQKTSKMILLAAPSKQAICIDDADESILRAKSHAVIDAMDKIRKVKKISL